MTEREAQKWLERFEWDDSEETSEALATICETLQEYPKYREIGTPTQIYEKIGGLDVELGKYRSIGTVEEFKAIKQWKSDVIEGFCKYDASSIEELVRNVRNKAIDEFAEKLKAELNKRLDEPAYHHSGEDYYVGICSAENIVDEIAEQMKGV